MSRQLFIYWKVDVALADDAAVATRAMQALLGERCPGLQASLFRRSDEHGPQVTLMEVYGAPSGVDGTLQSVIELAALEGLAAFTSGARHVEVFTRV